MQVSDLIVQPRDHAEFIATVIHYIIEPGENAEEIFCVGVEGDVFTFCDTSMRFDVTMTRAELEVVLQPQQQDAMKNPSCNNLTLLHLHAMGLGHVIVYRRHTLIASFQDAYEMEKCFKGHYAGINHSHDNVLYQCYKIEETTSIERMHLIKTTF